MNWPIKLKRFLLMCVGVGLVMGFIEFLITLLGPIFFPEHLTIVQCAWWGVMLLTVAGITWRFYKRCEDGEIFIDDSDQTQW